MDLFNISVRVAGLIDSPPNMLHQATGDVLDFLGNRILLATNDEDLIRKCKTIIRSETKYSEKHSFTIPLDLHGWKNLPKWEKEIGDESEILARLAEKDPVRMQNELAPFRSFRVHVTDSDHVNGQTRILGGMGITLSSAAAAKDFDDEVAEVRNVVQHECEHATQDLLTALRFIVDPDPKPYSPATEGIRDPGSPSKKFHIPGFHPLNPQFNTIVTMIGGGYGIQEKEFYPVIRTVANRFKHEAQKKNLDASSRQKEALSWTGPDVPAKDSFFRDFQNLIEKTDDDEIRSKAEKLYRKAISLFMKEVL